MASSFVLLTTISTRSRSGSEPILCFGSVCDLLPLEPHPVFTSWPIIFFFADYINYFTVWFICLCVSVCLLYLFCVFVCFPLFGVFWRAVQNSAVSVSLLFFYNLLFSRTLNLLFRKKKLGLNVFVCLISIFFIRTSKRVEKFLRCKCVLIRVYVSVSVPLRFGHRVRAVPWILVVWIRF